jgi:hypothetical protein
MAWSDFFKVISYAFTDDPVAKRRRRDPDGAGVSQPDAMPDIRAGADGSWGGGRGSIRLRDTNDFVDLSTVTNRIHRYKEYERLRNMAEIEMAMTVFADEACLAGNTKVATPHGFITIKELAETAEERFLVYCYDFDKRDYSLGWAFNPRKTKTASTIKVMLDDGNHFICTPDHKILLRDGKWLEAGGLEFGHELMPFYRIPARQEFTNIKTNQFPRIWTHDKGWIHERQFVDEWRTGHVPEDLRRVNRYCQMIAEGLTVRQINDMTGSDFRTVRDRIERAGFSNKEMKWLGKREDHRRVVGIQNWEEIDVYDLSVEKHQNFCTDWGVVHNCQKDDDGRTLKVECANEDVKEELEFLLFHRTMLHFDQNKTWDLAKRLFINGDFFYEVLIDLESPKDGIIGLTPLPPDSMYRIETTKGKLVEFQQSKEGPDYQSLARVEVTQATEADLQQATAIRFAPEQVVHMKIGDDRKTFYPYGVSLIEAARGPAHQLRLMEDAMVVYRLTRAPERRVFYIDVQQMPPFKAEAFMERMKDQFKKKKVANTRGSTPGASSVEERWHAPAADEDYWIPIRPNANTRVETLPGAQNLGEIDDTVYFRNKLFTALNFPRNYFNNEDTQSTRIALSAQDIKFARMIERLQSHIQDAFWEICDRHLRLRGFPEDSYEDLEIKMTPPSDWRELTRAEVITNRLNNAANLKGSQLMSDYDILTQWLKYPEDEAKKMLARLKIQKLEELKLQIIAQNPTLLGVGLPGPDETEIGAEPGGPNPMLGAEPQVGMEGGMGGAPPPGATAMRKYMDAEEGGADPQQGQMPPGGQGIGMEMAPQQGETPMAGSGTALPDASDEDIQKFDLDIKDFAQEMDEEEIDRSEEG